MLRFRRGQADNRVMVTHQRPVELILARGLMANIATPAFLVDADGTLAFFNDGAGDLLGLRYEDKAQSREIEVSAFPIVGNAGMRGAMAIFWDAGAES
jgi:PAS domain-containing protein